MAHNLEFNKEKGTHSFFSANEPAWHNLGKIVTGALTSAEAIKTANLDFEVEKIPVRIKLPNGKTFVSKDQFGTVRKDNSEVLGYVGNRYEILQNVQAFDFFDSIVGKGEAIYETAGVLGVGERIFITAKLPAHITIGKNDVIDQYIFLTNTHDGKGSVTAAFTPIRIVCNNTLNAALKTMKNKVTLRHTSGVHDKLKLAHEVMGIQNMYTKEITEIFNQMAKTEANEMVYKKIIVGAMADNDKMVKDYFEGNPSTKFKNNVNEVLEYAYGNETQKMASTNNTVYGAYNAVTGYNQNVNTYKDNDTKMKQILEGRSYNQQAEAFRLAVSFLN